MLRRHSTSPQTAFICDSVTDLPTSSVGETLRASVLKGQQIRAFLSKKKTEVGAKRREAEDVEIERQGVAHVVTQKLRISCTKGAQVFVRGSDGRKGHPMPWLVHSLLHLAESSFHNDAVGAQLCFCRWSAGVYKKSTAAFNCPQNAEND